jgi:sec-independent protein translocase protein TatB
MLGNLGLPEILLLAILGLVVFGPERLPRAARDAAKVLRQLREMSQQAMEDVKGELGPEFADLDLRRVHPRRLISDHLMGDGPDHDGGTQRETAAQLSVAADGDKP